MKRLWILLLIVVFSAGCSASDKMEDALLLRSKLITGEGCSFEAKIIADYIDTIYEFSLQCSFDNIGNMKFTVVEPASISGISGRIEGDRGKLQYEDRILGFSLMADDQVAPVSSPWILIRALRSGYISACSTSDSGCCITVDDSYDEDPMTLQVWTDAQLLPVEAEIIFRGRRILSLEIENFRFL